MLKLTAGIYWTVQYCTVVCSICGYCTEDHSTVLILIARICIIWSAARSAKAQTTARTSARRQRGMAATRLHASRFCASRRVPRKNHDRHIKHKFTQAPEHFHIKATTTKKTGLWSRVRKIQDFSSFFHKNARQHDSTTFFKITEGASVYVYSNSTLALWG